MPLYCDKCHKKKDKLYIVNNRLICFWCRVCPKLKKRTKFKITKNKLNKALLLIKLKDKKKKKTS